MLIRKAIKALENSSNSLYKDYCYYELDGLFIFDDKGTKYKIEIALGNDNYGEKRCRVVKLNKNGSGVTMVVDIMDFYLGDSALAKFFDFIFGGR